MKTSFLLLLALLSLELHAQTETPPATVTPSASVPTPSAPVSDEVEIIPDAPAETSVYVKPGAKLNQSDPRETPAPIPDDAILESPTQALDAYEEARAKMMHERSFPKWSAGIIIEPFAFKRADLRTPPVPQYSKPIPKLTGYILTLERMLVTGKAGLLAVGFDIGLYNNLGTSDNFDEMQTAFLSLAPMLSYQMNYFRKQFLVPTFRGGSEWIRYKYFFNRATVSDLRILARFDIGMMIFLNPLEDLAAGNLYTGYGIKRTYLTVFYTMGRDASKKDFNLSEDTFRVGLKFEF